MNSLNFDIGAGMSNLLAPYKAPIAIFVLLSTVVLSACLFVPVVRDAVGFQEWSDGVIIIATMIWLTGALVTFMLMLTIFGITLQQFGNAAVIVDLMMLITFIVIAIFVSEQSFCTMTKMDCVMVNNIIWLFLVLQLPILGITAHIKFKYAMRKRFGRG